ncbi:MAG: hypothetical protein PHY45_11805 [Rhodocyclaceae bacterium]|nr:hypothetical protein [Rhodocyclaceae bacterium]
MPAIPIIHVKPASALRLGGAHFFEPITESQRRCIGVDAEAGACERPIDLHVQAAGQRSMTEMTVDEAEALIACLAHAVALRRNADADLAGKAA